ncbi:glycosyltransferase family 2 protein [Candidatus Woesebacteria bacterium]|nr:glycosyltransferase family 2 protein [Candidatus Woesebacteria bacterium]
MKNHLSIITVVYNNYDVLEDFFKSLNKQIDTNFTVYIADTSSRRHTIQKQGFPTKVMCVENKGYAHGVNVALQKATENGGEQFCVINTDVFFKENFVEKVKESLGAHTRSLIGGKIYYAPGYEYHTDRYGDNDRGNVLWYAGGTVDWKNTWTQHVGVDEVDHGQYDEKKETGFITGCCICFDKTVYEALGPWDEHYFLYYEDADYCQRAKKNNVRLVYDPHIVLWHKNAQSTEGSGSKLHMRYQKKAQLRFALKFAPWRTKLHVLKNYF